MKVLPWATICEYGISEEFYIRTFLVFKKVKYGAIFFLTDVCEPEKLLPILKLIKNRPNISNLVNGSVYIYTEITIKVWYAMN